MLLRFHSWLDPLIIIFKWNEKKQNLLSTKNKIGSIEMKITIWGLFRLLKTWALISWKNIVKMNSSIIYLTKIGVLQKLNFNMRLR